MKSLRLLNNGEWNKPPVLTAARKLLVDALRAQSRGRPLGDLASFVNGTSYDRGQLIEGGAPIIRISNISNPRSEYISTGETFDERFHIQSGDLLVSWSASFKSIIWPGPDGILNQHIFKVTERAGNHRGYIRHAIEAVFDEMQEKVVGIGMMHLRRQDFLGYSIPAPDLQVQEQVSHYLDWLESGAEGQVPVLPQALDATRRVIEKIEELSAKITEARSIQEEVMVETEVMVASALKHLRLPSNAVTVPIGQCSRMSTGTTPPSHRSDYYDGSIQWYTPGDLAYQQRLSESSRTLSEQAVVERKARLFEPGTILLVAIGGSLGKVGLTHERCSANQQITGIKFSEQIVPEYGFWWMRRLGKDLMTAAPQATLPIINQERIGVFEITFPSLDEQRRIVEYLDGLQAKVDAVKRLQEETGKELNAMMPSVLSRAFSGHL